MTEARVYTRRGDDGTTGLLHGGRVAKDSPQPTAYGDVDEAQAAIGLARSAAGPEMDAILVGLERDLWLVMAELACNPDQIEEMEESGSRPTPAMVTALIHRPSSWCLVRTRCRPVSTSPARCVAGPSVPPFRWPVRGRRWCHT